MERRVLLDIVVTQRASVLELLATKDESLLIRRNAFLVLNLRLDGLNRIRRIRVERNSLPSQGLDENLHLCLWTS